jgi:tetratricopeptide (TPR) repeat protein
MHQNLIEREDLKQDLKLQALAELGQDYLKAGLLDRAEEVFDKLRDSELAESAKRNLLEIYQLEKDWEKAIAIASELPDFASHKEVAEYYCELAAAEMMRSRGIWRRRTWIPRWSAIGSAFEPVFSRGTFSCSRISRSPLSNHGSGSSSRIQLTWHWSRSVCLTLFASWIDAKRDCSCCVVILNTIRRLTCWTWFFSWCSKVMGPTLRTSLVRDELKRNPTLLGFDKLMAARLLFASPDNRR